MKCSLSGNTWSGSSWDGTSEYTKETKEYVNGEYVTVTAAFRAYPNVEASIADHSAYLLGAKKGEALRYAGLKGEKDYKKAVQIIKDGGYATAPDYVNKVCSIIENTISPLMISRNRQQQKAGIVSERTGAMPRARLERTIRLNMQRLV